MEEIDLPVAEGRSVREDDELPGRGARDAELTLGADTDGRLTIDDEELGEEDGRAVIDEAMMDTTVLDSAAAGGTAMEDEGEDVVEEADGAVGVTDVTESVDETTGAVDEDDSTEEATGGVETADVTDSVDEATRVAEDATDETEGRAEDMALLVVDNSFVFECASCGTDMIVNPTPPFGPVLAASGAGVPVAALLDDTPATALVPASVGKLVAAILVETSAAALDAEDATALVVAISVVAVAEVAEMSMAPAAPEGAVTETV